MNLSLRGSEQKGATHHVEVLQARAVHDLQGPQVDHVQDLGLREKHLLVPVTTVLTPTATTGKDKANIWGEGRARRGQWGKWGHR